MRRTAVVLAWVSLAVAFAGAQEDERKPPRDSIQLIVTGCLDKRVLNAKTIEPQDMTAVRDFHLSGKKDLLAEVKDLNKRVVTVTGWVRKVDLMEPGMRIGNSHVRIGPVTSSDPTRPQVPAQTRRLVTMEAIKVEAAGGSCNK